MDQIPMEFLAHLNVPIEPLIKMRMASVTLLNAVGHLLDQIPMEFLKKRSGATALRILLRRWTPGRTGVPAALPTATDHASQPVLQPSCSFLCARGRRGDVYSRPRALEQCQTTVQPKLRVHCFAGGVRRPRCRQWPTSSPTPFFIPASGVASSQTFGRKVAGQLHQGPQRSQDAEVGHGWLGPFSGRACSPRSPACRPIPS